MDMDNCYKNTHSQSDHDPLGDSFSIGIVAVLGGW
jgi:hypothetical protein